MIKTTKNFKFNALLVGLLAVLFFKFELAMAQNRGIGEVDIQIDSQRFDKADSTSVERQLRLGLHGGLMTQLASGDRVSFGAFFKTDRGQQALGALNSYGAGLFIGWIKDALSLRLAYTALGELKGTNSAVETSWKDAAGYEVNLRWITWKQESESNGEFAFGPSLSYEKISYKKSQVGSLPETSQSLDRESIVPGISFVFIY